jgi:TrmH family RNA methyltransferase
MDGAVTSRVITSLANPKIKAARALHMRKTRAESGLFLAEGLKIVAEAVDIGRAPRTLLHSAAAAGHPLLARAAAVAGETIEVSPAVLAKISRRDNPQTVLGVFEQAFTPLANLSPRAARCWVALEAVRDPGNLGTVVRTADAAGCGAVILVGDCCDPYSVEAVRATMGSIFAVDIAKASLEGFLVWLKSWPGGVAGAVLTATTDYRAAVYRDPTLILMGAEQAGLTGALIAACDMTVKIPMRGRADSLNLAVAAGILIYAVTG